MKKILTLSIIVFLFSAVFAVYSVKRTNASFFGPATFASRSHSCNWFQKIFHPGRCKKLGASGFPTSLDNPVNGDVIDSTFISTLQSTVGVTGSAVTSSLTYQIANVSSTDPGHIHNAWKSVASSSVVESNIAPGTITNSSISNSAAISSSKISGLITQLSRASFTAGDNLFVGNPVFVGDGSNVVLDTGASATGSPNSRPFGDIAARSGERQFMPSNARWRQWNTIQFVAAKNGSPGDSLKVAAWNYPGMTTEFASGTVPTSSLSTATSTINVTLNAQVATQNVWVLFSRTGAVSSTNYYTIGQGVAADNPNGECEDWSGTASSTGSGFDCTFNIRAGTTAGRIYQTSAAYASSSQPFIGFVNAAASSTVSASVDLAGLTSALTGLVPGDRYYLSSSTAALSLTAGPTSIGVGIAASSTGLVIMPTF